MKFSKNKFKVVSILLGIGIVIEFTVLAKDFSFLRTQSFLSTTSNTLSIQFTGSNQTWRFLYAGKDGLMHTSDDVLIEGSENLVLPMNTSIEIDMVSKDYIYCLDIPELEKTQIAIPEMKFLLYFSTLQTDTFSLVPGSICGRIDNKLYRKIFVVPHDEFQSWVNQMKSI